MNERRQNLIENYHHNKISGAALLVDNVFDVHNVAAISRSADALGISTVYMYYTYNKFPEVERKGKASSSSANKWIKFVKVADLGEFASTQKSAGVRIIGTKMDEAAHNLTQFVFPPKFIVVMGGERDGMSPEVSAICDEFVFIPMVGMVESYNISVASAIFMYEIYKQRGTALSLKSFQPTGVRA